MASVIYGKCIMANVIKAKVIMAKVLWQMKLSLIDYHYDLFENLVIINPTGQHWELFFCLFSWTHFLGAKKKYKNGGVIFMFLIFLIIRLVSLHSLFPATVNLSFFAKSFNKPWGQKSQKTGHNLTLGSSCLQSFKSSLQFYPLWVTLYL